MIGEVKAYLYSHLKEKYFIPKPCFLVLLSSLYTAIDLLPAASLGVGLLENRSSPKNMHVEQLSC
jgi:hypothetical protein